MGALSAAYGAAATWRRRWYAGSPARLRRLRSPVISVGNLRVGGTGKTPTTACIARLLLAHGERPAILSRGYARQARTPGVTVVSNRDQILTDVAHAGDEPMLLARSLPGVPVLVCADRYRAGRRAEADFDATVHLLDDGFQHVQLARDIDLLLVDEHDLSDRVLPAGRLREPLANAAVADAVIVPATLAAGARAVADRLGVREAFTLSRVLGSMSSLPGGDHVPVPDAPVFAIAGIARPERFFDDLRGAGFAVAGVMPFPDHHVFRSRDIDRAVAAARAAGAAAVVTTEKDAMRLEGLDLAAMPFAAIALDTRIEPEDAFAAWLTSRLAQARSARDRTVR